MFVQHPALARAFEDGRYVRGVTAPTQSPAMDIQSASNFERLYFECVRRDGVETARAFRAFAETGTSGTSPLSPTLTPRPSVAARSSATRP